MGRSNCLAYLVSLAAFFFNLAVCLKYYFYPRHQLLAVSNGVRWERAEVVTHSCLTLNVSAPQLYLSVSVVSS